MFDDDPISPTTPPAAAGGGGPLGAPELARMREGISLALTRDSGLADADRIDTIRALEELVCVATAAQAKLSAELDHSVCDAEAALGVPAARRGRGVASQVALARRESPHRASRHLGLAKVVAAELPCTWAAWRSGRITQWKATLVARETACLSLADRREVDRLVAADPQRLEAMGDRELERKVRAHADRLDPAAAVARRRKAESERTVTIRPAPDTMTWVTGLLPVAEGVAVHAALARAAASARAAGDPRSKGQVMADTLVGAVLGHRRPDDAADHTDSPTDGGDAADAPDRPGKSISLGLVMTDTALFGTSDEPAHLDGFGPIPAELAREIVADACTDDERIWLHRLYTSPSTGELAAMDASGRAFRASLGRFIRLRDQSCRTPWCDAPVRHLDHATDASRAGPTSAANGQGLCEACNYAKQSPGWDARPSPGRDGHEIQTTTPTGHTYRSRPPVLATIHRHPIHLDYVLAG